MPLDLQSSFLRFPPRDDMSLGRVETKRFTIGKYIIVAQPIPHSAHMLRYTVYLGKQRLGALASMPSEADCRYLEKPPVVPPLKIFYVTSRPGRPKKGSKPPATPEQKNAGYTQPGLSHQDLPDLHIPRAAEDR
jgi:hypothetical protein